MNTTATHQPTPADCFEVTSSHMNDNGYSYVTEETFAVYTGAGEGYTGIRTGDYVTVVRTTYFRPDGTVARESFAAHKGGASLSVDPADLTL